MAQLELKLKGMCEKDTQKGYFHEQDVAICEAFAKLWPEMLAYAKEKGGKNAYPMIEVRFLSATQRGKNRYQLYILPIVKGDVVQFHIPNYPLFRRPDLKNVATGSISCAALAVSFATYEIVRRMLEKDQLQDAGLKTQFADGIMHKSEDPDELQEMIDEIWKTGLVNLNFRAKQHKLNARIKTEAMTVRVLTDEQRRIVWQNDYKAIWGWKEEDVPIIANMKDLKDYIDGGDKTANVPFVFGIKKVRKAPASKEDSSETPIKKQKLSNADISELLRDTKICIATDPHNKDLNFKVFSLLSLSSKIKESAVVKAGETQFAVLCRNKELWAKSGEEEDDGEEKKKKKEKRKSRDDEETKESKRDKDEDDKDGDGAEGHDQNGDAEEPHDDAHSDKGASDNDGEDEESSSESDSSDQPSDGTDKPVDAVTPAEEEPRKPYNRDFYKKSGLVSISNLKATVLKSFNNTKSEHVQVESSPESKEVTPTPLPSPRDSTQCTVDTEEGEIDVEMPNSPDINMIPKAIPDQSTSISVASPQLAESSLLSPAPQVSEFDTMECEPTGVSVGIQASEPVQSLSTSSSSWRPTNELDDRIIKTVTQAVKFEQKINGVQMDCIIEDQRKLFGNVKTMNEEIALLKDSIMKNNDTAQKNMEMVLELLQDQKNRSDSMQNAFFNYIQKPVEKAPETMNPKDMFFADVILDNYVLAD